MHLKERVRLSHSTKAHIITTELTNRNQQEKCCAFFNLTQRAHKLLFAKCFGLLSFQLLLHPLPADSFSYSFIACIIMSYML